MQATAPQNHIGYRTQRRQSAVSYARASVGLEGFSLSETDEAHAQRFIDGQISLQEFVQPRADALTLPKSSS